LQTLTEVSAAFVGFSMLANALRSSRGDELMRFMNYRDVAEIGLIGVLGSLAPLLLYSFGWPEETAWRWSSAIFGAAHIVGAFASGRRRNRTIFAEDEQSMVQFLVSNPLRVVPAFSCLAVVFVLAITNTVAPGPLSGARHVSAVAISLGIAGWFFLFAAFGPHSAASPRPGNGSTAK
jgi:hypothetical protein